MRFGLLYLFPCRLLAGSKLHKKKKLTRVKRVVEFGAVISCERMIYLTARSLEIGLDTSEIAPIHNVLFR